jgi:hypothetical protein
MLTPAAQSSGPQVLCLGVQTRTRGIAVGVYVGLCLGIECALGVGRLEYLDKGGDGGLMQLARSRSWLMMPERYAGCLCTCVSASSLVACSTQQVCPGQVRASCLLAEPSEQPPPAVSSTSLLSALHPSLVTCPPRDIRKLHAEHSSPVHHHHRDSLFLHLHTRPATTRQPPTRQPHVDPPHPASEPLHFALPPRQLHRHTPAISLTLTIRPPLPHLPPPPHTTHSALPSHRPMLPAWPRAAPPTPHSSGCVNPTLGIRSPGT